MTTTEASLENVKEIIDEYIKHDLGGIFRDHYRHMACLKTKTYSYRVNRWLEFYKEGLDYIVDLNRQESVYGILFATDFKENVHIH